MFFLDHKWKGKIMDWIVVGISEFNPNLYYFKHDLDLLVPFTNMAEPSYNDIASYNTLPIQSDYLWYQLP
jgi:hypothetical protein